eukprot:jgi/Tetstr1/462371/TSEL_007377.t1
MWAAIGDPVWFPIFSICGGDFKLATLASCLRLRREHNVGCEPPNEGVRAQRITRLIHCSYDTALYVFGCHVCATEKHTGDNAGKQRRKQTVTYACGQLPDAAPEKQTRRDTDRFHTLEAKLVCMCAP